MKKLSLRPCPEGFRLPQPLKITSDLLPAVVGHPSNGSVLLPGESLELCSLNAGDGTLLISKDHNLTAVLFGTGNLVQLYTFRQTAPAVWDTISSQWPHAMPGRGFARFHMIEEVNDYGFTPHYGLLDLISLDIILRATRSQVEELRDAANNDPEEVLQQLAIADATHAYRSAVPRVAAAMAGQAWMSWNRRLGSSGQAVIGS